MDMLTIPQGGSSYRGCEEAHEGERNRDTLIIAEVSVCIEKALHGKFGGAFTFAVQPFTLVPQCCILEKCYTSRPVGIEKGGFLGAVRKNSKSPVYLQ